MRRVAFFLLACALPAFAADNSTNRGPQNQLPASVAEPENNQAFAPPSVREEEGPSEADRGPVQRHFVLASEPDNLGALDEPPTSTNGSPEHMALDKRINIALVHDVENDSAYKGGENHALLYEVTYLNWGAVTQEQLKARRGHYFTITWDNHGPRADLTAKFEYRQVKSKEVVRSLSQAMPHVSGGTRSYFAVIDKAYLAYGPVSSWRFTIRRGDTVVAEAKSFLW